MTERTRTDSGRDLLEELEEGWGTPRAPSVATAPAAAPFEPEIGEEDGEEEAVASAAAKVDEGWLDDLFPGGDDEDEEEPELPDERLDPVAFAAAKKARDERARQKRERKKTRADVKRARQKERGDAIKARQKPKSKKSRAVTPAPRSARALEKAARASARGAAVPTTDGTLVRTAAASPTTKASSAKATPAKAIPAKPSTLASLKLLGIVLAVLLAIAAVAAALMK